jgi:lysophospholipase L1-like esterase
MPKRTRFLLVNFALSIGSLLIGVFLIEGITRVRTWVRYGTTGTVVDKFIMYDQQLGIPVPKPGSSVRGTLVDIRINSLGFRGEEFSFDKSPHSVRIVALGGSTTFCSEVSSNSSTWSSRLQELLQSRYPQVKTEVINAGFPGYTIKSSKLHLQARVLPLKPDIVLFYHAYNDMVQDSYTLAKNQGLARLGSGSKQGFIEYLSKYSTLVSLVDMNFSYRIEKDTGKLTTLPPQMPNRFIGYLKEIHNLCQENNCQLVLSAFVVKFRKNQQLEHQIRNAGLALHQMPFMTLNTLYAGFDLYNRAIESYATRNSLPFIADMDTIPGDNIHFFDSIHFTDEGTKKMAHRFFEAIVRGRLIEKITIK